MSLSKTKINRKARYQEFLKKGLKPEEKVISRANEIGFVLKSTTPYTGEAGYSSRLLVLWEDGSVTKCCVKGMKMTNDGWKIL